MGTYLEDRYTSEQWEQLGRDIDLFRKAFLKSFIFASRRGGVHRAELAACFEDVAYVLDTPLVDLIACAEFYFPGSDFVEVLVNVDYGQVQQQAARLRQVQALRRMR